MTDLSRIGALLDQNVIHVEWRKRCKASFRTFVERAWPHVEGGTFVPGKHIDIICRLLTEANQGISRRQLHNLPPRHSKSVITSVMWPAWTWLQEQSEDWPLAGPQIQFMYISHSDLLALRDSRKCRALVTSQWYQDLCEGSIKLRVDGGAGMGSWELESGGSRHSMSVRSGVTGLGADIQCTDDPSDVLKVESAADRETVRILFDESLPSRVNDPKNNARIVTCQRTHLHDLSGHILTSEQASEWVHLCLPARYSDDHPFKCDLDWRTEDGQLLWPERFDDDAYDGLAGTIYSRNAQVDQNPQKRGGSVFANARWEIVDDYPRDAKLVRFWDKAATEEGAAQDPDYTAGVLMAMKDGIYYVVHVKRGRWGSANVERKIRETAEADGRGVSIYIEEEPGSSGKDVTYNYQRALTGYSVRGRRATGPVLVRVDPYLSSAEAGNVWLVRGDWNSAFLDEHDEWTGGDAEHDDQIIASAGAHREVARKGQGVRRTRLHGV